MEDPEEECQLEFIDFARQYLRNQQEERVTERRRQHLQSQEESEHLREVQVQEEEEDDDDDDDGWVAEFEICGANESLAESLGRCEPNLRDIRDMETPAR